MALNKKYLRGVVGYVAKELGITYSGARQALINNNPKANKIALEIEERILIQEQREKELLREKEIKVNEMKKNLGMSAVQH